MLALVGFVNMTCAAVKGPEPPGGVKVKTPPSEPVSEPVVTVTSTGSRGESTLGRGQEKVDAVGASLRGDGQSRRHSGHCDRAPRPVIFQFSRGSLN